MISPSKKIAYTLLLTLYTATPSQANPTHYLTLLTTFTLLATPEARKPSENFYYRPLNFTANKILGLDNGTAIIDSENNLIHHHLGASRQIEYNLGSESYTFVTTSDQNTIMDEKNLAIIANKQDGTTFDIRYIDGTNKYTQYTIDFQMSGQIEITGATYLNQTATKRVVIYGNLKPTGYDTLLLALTNLDTTQSQEALITTPSSFLSGYVPTKCTWRERSTRHLSCIGAFSTGYPMLLDYSFTTGTLEGAFAYPSYPVKRYIGITNAAGKQLRYLPLETTTNQIWLVTIDKNTNQQQVLQIDPETLPHDVGYHKSNVILIGSYEEHPLFSKLDTKTCTNITISKQCTFIGWYAPNVIGNMTDLSINANGMANMLGTSHNITNLWADWYMKSDKPISCVEFKPILFNATVVAAPNNPIENLNSHKQTQPYTVSSQSLTITSTTSPITFTCPKKKNNNNPFLQKIKDNFGWIIIGSVVGIIGCCYLSNGYKSIKKCKKKREKELQKEIAANQKERYPTQEEYDDQDYPQHDIIDLPIVPIEEQGQYVDYPQEVEIPQMVPNRAIYPVQPELYNNVSYQPN